MTHNSSSRVQVTNNFPYAADITINHTYDTSAAESFTWKNVLPGTTTGPDLTVTYNLGLFSPGHDYWQAEVTVLAGPAAGHYISDVAPCTLHSPDVGKVLTMMVDDQFFVAVSSKNHDNAAWTTHP